MECNRDEALRSKEIAENKYAENDIVGARKFALKAQALFPGLDGISQMIATLDVFTAAEIRINGEKDWYAVLCLNPLADEDMIKKQYRKFALILHPDKNKSVGAEAAFQIISEAFSVLSDKTKRMVYDHKRNQKARQQTLASSQGGSGSSSHAAKTASTNLKVQKTNAHSAPSTIPSASPPPTHLTFWTLCQHCNMRYEYLRIYLNNTLLCPSCRRPFVATELKMPKQEFTSFVHRGTQQTSSQFQNLSSAPSMRPSVFQSTSASSHHNLNQMPKQKFSTFVHRTTQQTSNQYQNVTSTPSMGPSAFQPASASSDSHYNQNHQFGAFVKTPGMQNIFNPTKTVNEGLKSTNMASADVRKVCEEKIQAVAEEKLKNMDHPKQVPDGLSGGAASDGSKQFASFRPEKSVKKQKIAHDNGMRKMQDYFTQKSTSSIWGNKELHSNGFKVESVNHVPVDSLKSKFGLRQASIPKKNIANLDIHNMLTQKAQKLIRLKLEMMKDAAAKMAAQKEASRKKKRKHSATEKQKYPSEENQDDDVKMEDPSTKNKHTDSKEVQTQKANEKSNMKGKDLVDGMEEEEVVAIQVPDPDFHDFDKERSETAFAPGQLWAVYDDEDGMPRFYAFVHKVISRQPLKLRISYLESNTNSEFSSLNWVGMGFAKVCGDFTNGRQETCNNLNMFSHIVNPDKHGHVFKVLPRKDDIWALYRNWSPDWNANTLDDVIYKYDMVEVLEDYNEKHGVAVRPLVKYAGFRTVFSRSTDMKDVIKIPKEEIFRFSHQVPSCVLTGEEAHNAPSGCFELDPAATPLELLQVTTEIKQEVPTTAVKTQKVQVNE